MDRPGRDEPGVSPTATAAGPTEFGIPHDDPALLEVTFEYDPEKSAARAAGLKDLYGAIFVDAGPELKAAWKAIIARGLDAADLKKLCTPPIAEAELLEFSTKQWHDNIARNRMIAAWGRDARERYKALAE